jgi:hypothetical protein
MPDARRVADVLQSWLWDGSYDDERANVRIPVQSARAKGQLYGAAILIGGKWEVLGLELRIEEITAGAVQSLRARDAEKEGDEITLPEAPEQFAGLSYDVIGKRWLSGAYEIKAESEFVIKHAHSKAAMSVLQEKVGQALPAPAVKPAPQD